MTTIHSGSALMNCNHSFPDLRPRVSAVISRTSVIKPLIISKQNSNEQPLPRRWQHCSKSERHQAKRRTRLIAKLFASAADVSFYLRNIAEIRYLRNEKTATVKRKECILVTSRLDCGNSLLFRPWHSLLNKLQRVQSTSAGQVYWFSS